MPATFKGGSRPLTTGTNQNQWLHVPGWINLNHVSNVWAWIKYFFDITPTVTVQPDVSSCEPLALRLFYHSNTGRCSVCLLHLYPPVTRKRRWRYILDELQSLRSCLFLCFPAVSLTFCHLICYLFEATKAELIIVKSLFQGRSNVYDEGGNWT